MVESRKYTTSGQSVTSTGQYSVKAVGSTEVTGRTRRYPSVLSEVPFSSLSPVSAGLLSTTSSTRP